MSDESFLYLTTRGRKTGLSRQIEIWFVERAGRYYMIAETGEEAGWVQNVRAHPTVELSIGIRADKQCGLPSTRATARIVDPASEPELTAAVRGLMDAKYSWSTGAIAEIVPLRRPEEGEA